MVANYLPVTGWSSKYYPIFYVFWLLWFHFNWRTLNPRCFQPHHWPYIWECIIQWYALELKTRQYWQLWWKKTLGKICLLAIFGIYFWKEFSQNSNNLSSQFLILVNSFNSQQPEFLVHFSRIFFPKGLRLAGSLVKWIGHMDGDHVTSTVPRGTPPRLWKMMVGRVLSVLGPAFSVANC